MEKCRVKIEYHGKEYAHPWEVDKEIYHDVIETGEVFGGRNDFYETRDEAIAEAIRVLQSFGNHAPPERRGGDKGLEGQASGSSRAERPLS